MVPIALSQGEGCLSKEDGSEEQPECARRSGHAGDCQGILVFPGISNTGADHGALTSLSFQLHILCLYSCKPASAQASQKAPVTPLNKLPGWK